MKKTKGSKKGTPNEQLDLVKFKPEVSVMTKNKILAQMHKKIMAFKGWTIERPQYQTFSWKLVFKEMQQAFCSSFQINQSQTPTLLIQIAYPKFSQLQHLELRSNGIENIEALCFLDMELIQRINMETNQVVNLSPMDKLNLPHLHTIRFLQNPIETTFQINRINCHKDWLDFDLATNALKCSLFQVETFRFFPKIPTQAIFFRKRKTRSQVQKIFPCTYQFHILKFDFDPFKSNPNEQ